MIVDFGVAPSALSDISSRSDGVHAKALRRSLIESILAHGSVVLSGKKDAQKLFDSVRRGSQLTEQEKTEWSELLLHLRSERRFRVAKPGFDNGLDEISTPADLDSLRSDDPLLAVLGRERFASFYPGNADGVETLTPDLTIATAGSASESSAVADFRSLASTERHLPGSNREMVWNQLFEPLARRSKRVSIFDRYLFSELYRRDGSPGGITSDEHLLWLLRKLDSSGSQGSSVSIYGGLGFGKVPARATEVASLINGHWTNSGGRITSIEIIGCEWRPGVDPHNRHLRFGESWGYDLLEGLDRLKDPTLGTGEGFTWNYKWRRSQIQQMLEREDQVEQAPSRVRARVL